MDWDIIPAPPGDGDDAGATAMLAGLGALLLRAPVLLIRTTLDESLLMALVGLDEPLPPTPTLPSRLMPWMRWQGKEGGKRKTHESDALLDGMRNLYCMKTNTFSYGKKYQRLEK